LAYCFEVAEHIPPDLGLCLVEFLTDLDAPVIFSASQPGQGGLDHINEQPPEYWIAQFARFGYSHSASKTDELRTRLGEHGATERWLLQNTLVFMNT
jgi:hypothetical protein